MEKSIVHSRVFTLGKLDLGEKGILVGGEIWAAGGVTVESIGRADAPGAVVRVGSNYETDRKLRHVREHGF